jgi:hypothetical protein
VIEINPYLLGTMAGGAGTSFPPFPFVVPQLVQPALDAEVGFPVLAVGCVM